VHNHDLSEDVESSVTSQNLMSNDTYLDFHVFLVDKLKYITHQSPKPKIFEVEYFFWMSISKQ
jgi:hypothetical protein